MADEEKKYHLTPEQLAFLKGPRPRFAPKSAEQLAAEAKQMEGPAAQGAVARNEIGYKMPDGTIFAGVSPDTGEPMFSMPQDAPRLMRFHQAVEYASNLEAHGHKDWRLPTKDELNVLFNNRAVIGQFNETGDLFETRYWSTTPEGIHVWGQNFNAAPPWATPNQNLMHRKLIDSSVRCIR